jgi:hypothetical protein
VVQGTGLGLLENGKWYMTIEKRDPIPIGYYWLDLTKGNMSEGGLFDNNDADIDPLKSENFQVWMKASNGAAVYGVARERVKTIRNEGPFKLFQVLEPVRRWSAKWNLGLPTIAPYNEKSTWADISQKPQVEEIVDLDKLDDLASGVGEKAAVVGIAAIVSTIAVPVSIIIAVTYLLGKLMR